MKDWNDPTKLPPWTSQYSVPNRFDAMDCVAESFGNIVYMLTGFDSSPRALAKLSNTTPSGNSQTQVLNAANKYGLIPYLDWQTPDYFDWGIYYDEIPSDVMLKAVFLQAKIVPGNFDVSPLWTVLKFSNGAQHAVMQLNKNQYFDSEQGDIVKPIDYAGAQIIGSVSLQVTLTPMNLINDNGTFYIVGDKGKIGIADPVALAKLQAVTSQQSVGSSGTVPQVGVFKSVNVDKNTNLSLLVNN